MSLPMEYLPFVLIGLLTLMQVWMHLSARKMKGKLVVGLDEQLSSEQLQAERLVIYFSSDFCQPCKAMSPMIDALVQQGGTIVKLDAMEQGELASRLGARGAPAFVMMERGIVNRGHLGSMTGGKLREFLQL